MKKTLISWGLLGAMPLFGAFACSGTVLNDVGEINSGGHAGSTDVPRGGSIEIGAAGNEAGAGRSGGAPVFGVGGAHPIIETAGSSPTDDAQGGEAGASPGGLLNCPRCTLIADGIFDVRSIAVDDTRVVWANYGTQDTLGNYNDNGSILVLDLDADVTTASSLAYPISRPDLIALSANFVYVFKYSSPLAIPSLDVLRVPLAGGAPEEVKTVASSSQSFSVPTFASGGGFEFWTWDGAVYRVAETDGANVDTFLPAGSVAVIIGADDTRLYYEDKVGDWSVPFAGGDPSFLAATSDGSTGIQNYLFYGGDYIYGFEAPVHATDNGPVYLTRLPKAGGAWKRVVQYTSDVYFTHLAVDGDKYFIDQPTAGETVRNLFQGSLSRPGFLTLASESGVRWKAWQWSRVGIFFADQDGLYLTPTK